MIIIINPLHEDLNSKGVKTHNLVVHMHKLGELILNLVEHTHSLVEKAQILAAIFQNSVEIILNLVEMAHSLAEAIHSLEESFRNLEVLVIAFSYVPDVICFASVHHSNMTKLDPPFDF